MRFLLLPVGILLSLLFMALPQAIAQEGTIENIRGRDAAEISNIGPTELRRRPWRVDQGLLEAERLIVQDDCVEALKILDVVLERNLRSEDAHAYAAHCYIVLEDYEKADEALDYVFRINPRHYGGHYYRGIIALREGDLGEANDRLETLKSLCIAGECFEYQALREKILRYKKEVGADLDDRMGSRGSRTRTYRGE